MAFNYYLSQSALNFGKYKGVKLIDVITIDPSYLNFCIKDVDSFVFGYNTYKKILNTNKVFRISSEAQKKLIQKNSLMINEILHDKTRIKINVVGKNSKLFNVDEKYALNRNELIRLVYSVSIDKVQESIYSAFMDKLIFNMNINDAISGINICVICVKKEEIGAMLSWAKQTINTSDNDMFYFNSLSYWKEQYKNVFFINTVTSGQYSGVLLFVDYSKSEFGYDNPVYIDKYEGYNYERGLHGYGRPKLSFAKFSPLDYWDYMDSFGEDEDENEELQNNDNVKLINKKEWEDNHKIWIDEHNKKVSELYQSYKEAGGVNVLVSKSSMYLKETFWIEVLYAALDRELLDKFGIISNNTTELYIDGLLMPSHSSEVFSLHLTNENVEILTSRVVFKGGKTLDDYIFEDFRNKKIAAFCHATGVSFQSSIDYEEDNGNPWEDTWDAMTDGQYGDYSGGSGDYEGIGF